MAKRTHTPPPSTPTTAVGDVESGSGSLSESGSKGRGMGFGHEKLDVTRAAIESVSWAYRFCESQKSHRNAKDLLLRTSVTVHGFNGSGFTVE